MKLISLVIVVLGESLAWKRHPHSDVKLWKGLNYRLVRMAAPLISTLSVLGISSPVCLSSCCSLSTPTAVTEAFRKVDLCRHVVQVPLYSVHACQNVELIVVRGEILTPCLSFTYHWDRTFRDRQVELYQSVIGCSYVNVIDYSSKICARSIGTMFQILFLPVGSLLDSWSTAWKFTIMKFFLIWI